MKWGKRKYCVDGDVTDAVSVQHAFGAIPKELGEIDCLELIALTLFKKTSNLPI